MSGLFNLSPDHGFACEKSEFELFFRARALAFRSRRRKNVARQTRFVSRLGEKEFANREIVGGQFFGSAHMTPENYAQNVLLIAAKQPHSHQKSIKVIFLFLGK